MHGTRTRRLVVLIGVLLPAIVLTAVAVAAATSQTVLADGTTLHVRIVRTVANDFDSGWHTHPGPTIVQVQEGSFQITQANCATRTVGAGETFIETPYSPLRAVATGRIVWTATLLGRYEEKLSTPVASPCP